MKNKTLALTLAAAILLCGCSARKSPSSAPAAATVATTATTTDYATVNEINALAKANSYLKYSSFSKEGLIEQLEFEGFSHEEAVKAVEGCGANWNQQAALKAESYLKYSSFSREGLIEQLEYEGFTHSQAVYGVDACGL